MAQQQQMALLMRKHTAWPRLSGYSLPDSNSHAFIFIVEE